LSSRAYAPRVQQTAILAGPQRRPLTVTGLGIEGWAPFAAAAAAAAAISVLFAGWTAGHWISDSATVSIDDIGEAVAAFVAAASCGFASARTSGRTRVAWGLFALSALSWAVGEVVWSVYEVGMGVEVPFPSLADAGFLVAIPFAVAGVLAFTSAPTRLATRGETVLAGSIVALSLLFVAWAAGLSNVYATSTQSLATQVIALAYPVGDIIIATTLVVALRRARRADVGRMLLLIGGLACNALADSAFAYMTANGTYGVLGSALDTGWVVGYLLIALAPLWPARPTGTEAPEGPIELWQLGLPWVAVLAAAVTVIRMGALGQTLDPFASALAGGIGVLLVANQVLTHRDSLDLLDQSRRMEAQLARRNNLLDQIASHAPLGIARVGTDMKIIDVNPRMAALLRIEPQKMVGTAVADYLRQDEFERVFEVFQPLWRGAVDTVESDSRAIRADHSEVWLHWSATGVRNASGRIDYFIAMYEDNDAEHAANEAAAAHLAGLERLNRLKSEFVSLVSHEFRTALVGISGFSEMIRDEDVSLDEAKVYAGDINKDAVRLNRMINDMLDLDRIEAGGLTLHHQTVDMTNWAEEPVDRTRASSARRARITPSPATWRSRSQSCRPIQTASPRFSPIFSATRSSTRPTAATSPSRAWHETVSSR